MLQFSQDISKSGASSFAERMRDEEALLCVELENLKTEVQGFHATIQHRDSEILEDLAEAHIRIDKLCLLLHQALDKLAALAAQVRILVRHSEDTDCNSDFNLHSLD